MADDLVFYTHPMSRGRVARWMLEEVGAPYRTELLDYGTTMKAPAYLAINPMGKVPALVHNGVVITENTAICLYLADAFPNAGLAPAIGEPARGPYLRWTVFATSSFEPAVANHSMGFVVAPEHKGRMGYGSLEDVLTTVSAHLAVHDYFAAGRFTAADVVLGSQIGFALLVGMIQPNPVFDTYLARIMNRPAALRAAAIDDALVAPATE